MPTENNSTSGSTDETSGQEQQGQQAGTSGETSGTGDQQQASTTSTDSSTSTEPVKLPDDHPLVKTLAKQKLDLASSKTELAEARAKLGRVAELENELKDRPTAEALTTLQTRYDRLEAFLSAAGGPLSKALDSRSFTRDLFESDKDIKDIVKAYQQANPTATSTALGSSAAEPAGGKVDMNALLRSAVKS